MVFVLKDFEKYYAYHVVSRSDFGTAALYIAKSPYKYKIIDK
jgi:hypothetical protein